MKIAKEKVDLRKTLIAILTMLLGVVCVDLYLVVIRFIGNDYSVFKLAVFRNFFAVIPILDPAIVKELYFLVNFFFFK